jgi:hypothetical protein
MSIRHAILSIGFAFFLSGCAGIKQPNVGLSVEKISSPTVRVGVAISPLPKIDTFFPGADCLLCMAAASIANSSLTKYTQTLPNDDLSSLGSEVVELLRKMGADAKLIPENINIDSLAQWNPETVNFAKKNFMPLKEKYGIDKLVFINIYSVGMMRTYASYFPTSTPKASISALGVMVNLNDNTYDWYAPMLVQKATDGDWDEPPKFPGLTNAYFQAVEQFKDGAKKPFKP